MNADERGCRLRTVGFNIECNVYSLSLESSLQSIRLSTIRNNHPCSSVVPFPTKHLDETLDA